MNKRRWLTALFLPWALAAQPRNPFIPLLLPDCPLAAASPAGWRLKGIIGQPALRYGWILTPEGQWLRLGEQQRLIAERWRVIQIGDDRLTLVEQQTDPDCPASAADVLLTLHN